MPALHQVRGWSENDRAQRRMALKRLYREVAKRVHPDLTLDERDRGKRERLMGEANRAYEYGAAERLKKILEEYEAFPESGEEVAAAEPADLPRAVRSVTLNLRLQLTFIERYHNNRMKAHRSLLAHGLLAAASRGALREEAEEVADFFEEMQLFLRGGNLQEQLLWSTFGYSAVRWWTACKDYVIYERTLRNESALFAGFEDLAARFSIRDNQAELQPPTAAGVQRFLEDERNLAAEQVLAAR